MPEKAPLLEVRGLSLSFTRYTGGLHQSALPVLRGLELTVFPGQVVAAVGSSGSGKSLLAHAIFGILPQNAKVEGALFYQGAPLTPKRISALRGREIVLVPQGISYLDPLMQVGHQLRGSGQDAIPQADCVDVLSRYGLPPDTMKQYPFELSGGMARRVLISTAVLRAPRLVVADEPTPGLDVASAHRILGHFREMADEGAGILLITHDLELALSVADRVAIFYAGTTVEEALSKDFQQEDTLRHPYTKALWRALPQNGFTPLAGSQPYTGNVGPGCPFAPRCAERKENCAEALIYRPLRGGAVRCPQSN